MFLILLKIQRALQAATATPLWLERCIAARRCLPILSTLFRVSGPDISVIAWRGRFFEGFVFLLSFLSNPRDRV